MKLNIEELAREAGALPDNSHPAPETKHMRAKVDALNRFARIIVGRCAEECEVVSLQAVTAWKLAYQPVDQGREIGADECEHAIRNLLED